MNTLLSDPHWLDAGRALSRIMNARRDIFAIAPSEFQILGENVLPLEFSQVFRSIGVDDFYFCVPKNLWWKIASPYWPALRKSPLVYANDVFVIGKVERIAEEAHSITDPYFANCLESINGSVESYQSTVHRADLFIDGKRSLSWRPIKASSADLDAIVRESTTLCGGLHPVVIGVIGAAGVGNIGDDLILSAIELGVSQRRSHVLFVGAGGDLHPNVFSCFDSVIVGGGGILYAGNIERPQLENLANYFQFPYICEAASKPCHLAFVGVQGNVAAGLADCQVSSHFLTGALQRCNTISVRDRFSVEQIRHFDRKVAERSTLAIDPSFIWVDKRDCSASSPSAPRNVCSRALLLSGELRVFSRIVLQRRLMRKLLDAYGVQRIDFLVMSADDRFHGETIIGHLRRLGFEGEVIHPDPNTWPFDYLDVTLGSGRYAFHVTTRFHGTVASICAGVPVVCYDHRHGKKARLFADFMPEQNSSLIVAEDVASARIEFRLLRSAIEATLANTHSASIVKRNLEGLRLSFDQIAPAK
jgi:polysaccharide pyruvyl transferase WcaK-like protein